MSEMKVLENYGNKRGSRRHLMLDAALSRSKSAT